MSAQLPFPQELPEGGVPGIEFRTFADTRHADPAYHYEISLPNAWVQRETPPPGKRGGLDFVEMARFGNEVAGASVAAVTTERDFDPASTLEIDLAKRGDVVIRHRTRPTRAGTLPDVLSLCDGGRMIARTVCVKDGCRMFRVRAECPAQMYEEAALAVFACVGSHRLLAPSGNPFAEETAGVRVGDGPRASTKRFASWAVTETGSPLEGLEAVDLKTSHEGELGGVVRFGFAPRERGLSAHDVHVAYMSGLRDNGLAPFSAELGEVEPAGDFTAAFLAEPDISKGDPNGEAPFLVLDHPLGVVVLGYYGPTREADPFWWAVVTRAFEMARDSVRFEA